MKHALDLFSLQGRVTRLQYLVAGVLLAALKYPLDYLVSLAFQLPWNPLMYVSLRLSPLGSTLPRPYLLALLGVALPFLAAGVSLSARRLRDIGISPFWAGLFLLPGLHWAFIVALLAAPPSQPQTHEPDAGVYRRPGLGWAASAPIPTRWLPDGAGARFLLALIVSSGIGLLVFVVFQQLNNGFGAVLFMGLPFGMGFAMAFITQHGRTHPSYGAGIGYAVVPGVVVLIVLEVLAKEGLACILMSAPILLGMHAVGGAIAVAASQPARDKQPSAEVARVVFGPLLLAGSLAVGATTAPLHTVTTHVDVRAEPAAVWRALSRMPPIAAEPEAVFAIVAMPLEQRAESDDPLAARTWRFTNGDFKTRVVRAEPGAELALEVTEEPKALRRIVDVERGKLRLERLPDGSTRVYGSTELRLRLGPDAYWSPWADLLVDAVQRRMLTHLKAVAERPLEAGDAAHDMPQWMHDANESCPCTQHRSAD